MTIQMTPSINTPRLLLRLVNETDIDFVHDIISLPETDEFNTIGIPESIDDSRKILHNWMKGYTANPIEAYTFAIETKEPIQTVGLIGIKMGKPKYKIAEVWYYIHLHHWGKNYATEALKSVLTFGFDTLQLHRIEAGCATENIGSQRVMEKAGMQREGMRRKALPLKTGWADNYIYGILNGEQSAI